MFLEDKEKKMIHIINFLFEQQTTTVTLNNIGKRVGLTTQIVKKTLENYQVLKLSECGLSIESIDSTKITYQITEYSENRLQQLLVRKNSLFVLCQELFRKTFKNIDEFAADNYISVPTLYRKISVLKQLLNSYEIILDFRNDNYFIGEEHRIRHFLFELFYVGYGLTDEYREDSSDEIELFGTIPFAVAQRMRMMAFITQWRSKENNHIKYDFDFSVVHNLAITEIKAIELFSAIFPEELSAEQKKIELDFYFMYIVTFDVVTIDQFESITNLSVLMDNPYFEGINEWISLLLKEFKINISSKVYVFLVANLYYHLFRREILKGDSQMFLEICESTRIWNGERLYLLKKIENFLQSVNHLFSDVMNEKVFYYMLVREVLANSSKNVTICMFSGTAHTHKRIIQENIKKHSLVPIQFDDFISEKIDLVISDSFFNSDGGWADQNKAVLFISKYPSVEEYRIVISKVLHIFENKQQI